MANNVEVDPEVKFTYEYKYVPQDIDKRILPLFSEIDNVISNNQEGPPGFTEVHTRLVRRTEWLQSLMNQMDEEFETALQNANFSSIRNKILPKIQKLQQSVQNDRRLLSMTVDNITWLAENPEEASDEIYNLHFENIKNVLNNIFRIRSSIADLESYRLIYENINLAKNMNVTITNPHEKIPIPLKPATFKHDITGLAEALDRKIISVHFYSKGLTKRIALLKKRLESYKTHEKGVFIGLIINENINRKREWMGELEKIYHEVNDIKISRMKLIDLYKSVVEINDSAFHAYIGVSSMLGELRDLEKSSPPTDPNRLVEAFKSMVQSRERTYAQVARSKSTSEAPNPNMEIEKTLQSQPLKQQRYREPRHYQSRKSASREQAKADLEESYPPPRR